MAYKEYMQPLSSTAVSGMGDRNSVAFVVAFVDVVVVVAFVVVFGGGGEGERGSKGCMLGRPHVDRSSVIVEMEMTDSLSSSSPPSSSRSYGGQSEAWCSARSHREEVDWRFVVEEGTPLTSGPMMFMSCAEETDENPLSDVVLVRSVLQFLLWRVEDAVAVCGNSDCLCCFCAR